MRIDCDLVLTFFHDDLNRATRLEQKKSNEEAIKVEQGIQEIIKSSWSNKFTLTPDSESRKSCFPCSKGITVKVRMVEVPFPPKGKVSDSFFVTYIHNVDSTHCGSWHSNAIFGPEFGSALDGLPIGFMFRG